MVKPADKEKVRVKQDADYIFHELTRSICPECKTVIDAQIIIRDNKVYMRKRCPDHGWFEGIISSDAQMYVDSVKFNKPGTIPLEFSTEVKDGCPLDCGLCPEHKQHICLAFIEVNTAWSGNTSISRNADEPDGMNPDSLGKSDFSSETNGYTTMAQLVLDQAPLNPVLDDALNKTLVQEPESKTGHPIGTNLRARPYRELRPQVHLDNRKFIVGGGLHFRTADLLLPMAVGPYQNPFPFDPEEEWTTLAEALALALYYDARPSRDTFYELAGNTAEENEKVDRGQLDLYNFVPFFNTDGDPAGDPNDRMLFAATNQPEIMVYDTWFYGEIASIPIRDPIIGPLRVAELPSGEQFLVGITARGVVTVQLPAV
ncbi:MAG: hypothetical protein IH963_09780, partial [Chloroflexi bacterium]|nr:hypothetical protein [Chloroflexota bacterium]